MKLLYFYIFLALPFISFGNSGEEDSLLNELSISKDKARICNELSEYYKQVDLNQVKIYANNALFYASPTFNLKEEGKAYLNLGDYHYYSSDYDSSIIYYFKSLAVLSKINDNENIASAFSNIGSVYFTKGEYSKAILNFKKAASFQNLTGDLQETAVIYNNIATVYYYIDDYELSIDYYLKSLELKKQENDKLSVAKGLNNIANVYETIGDYDKAIDYYYESIKYCDEINNESLKSTTLNNIAGIYKDGGQSDKALELYEQALTIKSRIKDIDGEANVLNNIGVTYRLKGDCNSAEKYFVKAKQIFESIGNVQRLSRTYSNIGRVKEDKGNYQQAIDYYQKSLQINDSIKRPQGIASDNLDLARVFLLTHQILKSETHLRKSRLEVQKHNINSLKMETYKLLSNIQQAKGNTETALKNYIIYTQMKDSLFTIEKHQKLNEINTKYETEKKNKEIEILKIKEEKQSVEIKAKQQERNLWLTISLLAFTFLAISIYFFWNKKKLSDQLKIKNTVIKDSLNEKEVLLKEIHHRVKNNLQIITSLLNMQSRYLNDDKSKEIVNESKNRIKSMSLIHQKLYQQKNITGVETKIYFTELIEELLLSYGIDSESNVNLEIDNLILDVDTAIPLGLIINELVSNAFKHGFENGKGSFSFKFLKVNEKELFVEVKDNGKGIPDDYDISTSKSYGVKLIYSLSKKLKAEVNFINDKGLTVTMRILKFKISKPTKNG